MFRRSRSTVTFDRLCQNKSIDRQPVLHGSTDKEILKMAGSPLLVGKGFEQHKDEVILIPSAHAHVVRIKVPGIRRAREIIRVSVVVVLTTRGPLPILTLEGTALGYSFIRVCKPLWSCGRLSIRILYQTSVVLFDLTPATSRSSPAFTFPGPVRPRSTLKCPTDVHHP